MRISALLNIPPHFSIGEIDMVLPIDEEEWEAYPARPHPDLIRSRSEASGFRHVLERLLSAGKLPKLLNPFGLSIVAYTLYR